jgi:hypothetical protein
MVIQYLTCLANGLPPPGNLLHENFTFQDEHTTLHKDGMLNQDLFRGRKCAGTVELFADGASFGFKITQTIEFDPGFKTRTGRDIGGENDLYFQKKCRNKM